MTAFALYRLPHQQSYTSVIQEDDEPEELHSVKDLNGKSGFVIAPFMPSANCPILLMRPDTVTQKAVPSPLANPTHKHNEETVDEKDSPSYDMAEKEAYANDFHRFLKQIQEGRFQKVVLARCKRMTLSSLMPPTMEELFLRACQMYPRLFIALVSTPQSGTWLMATPEILLSGKGCDFATMSLAGTQTAPSPQRVTDETAKEIVWSTKNMEEQQYVSDYIEDVIASFTPHYSKKGPYTTMAAQLFHLRTDFQFHLDDTAQLGDVLEALFPTPAVCGMPKEEARQFIIDNESIERKYYSGFVGPLMPQGDTHLFVSLRCMNILQDGHFDLYAGGGLLAESELQKEWDETEAKLATMKAVLSLNV